MTTNQSKQDNIERAKKKIDAAINGSNGKSTNNNLLLEGIALLLLELVTAPHPHEHGDGQDIHHLTPDELPKDYLHIPDERGIKDA